MINKQDISSALNLYDSLFPTFLRASPQYANANGYGYLLLEKDHYDEEYRHAAAFQPLVTNATPLAMFAGLGSKPSVYTSDFTHPLTALFFWSFART